MNIILLSPQEIACDSTVTISDSRRLDHITRIHQAQVGDSLKIGVEGGLMGRGEITYISPDAVRLHCKLTEPPPSPLPITLLLGLPRPKMLKRILQSATVLGVKNIYLINSYRVEKSYWQTPFLSEKAIREQLVLGLEQGCDTVLPQVHLVKRFKPFVEDELPSIAADTLALVAHPYTPQECPRAPQQPITLAIGPEGGFIQYEIDLLEKAGFQAITLGSRILKVETAVPFLLSRLT